MGVICLRCRSSHAVRLFLEKQVLTHSWRLIWSQAATAKRAGIGGIEEPVLERPRLVPSNSPDGIGCRNQVGNEMLTDMKLKALKATGKICKAADQQGLYVAVTHGSGAFPVRPADQRTP